MAICALSYYWLPSLSLLTIIDTEVLIQMHLHARTECKPHFVKIGIMRPPAVEDARFDLYHPHQLRHGNMMVTWHQAYVHCDLVSEVRTIQDPRGSLSASHTGY